MSSPYWGYRRITAELAGTGHQVGPSTVWRILKQHDIDPAPQRSEVTWSQFLHSQAAVACDFLTVDTALLRRYYLLFFIDITTRDGHQPRRRTRHPRPVGRAHRRRVTQVLVERDDRAPQPGRRGCVDALLRWVERSP
ncbi:MAG: transposase [Desulfobulbaceae bacterium]|nr:transposase [Desulfobulbaceae bacterium]